MMTDLLTKSNLINNVLKQTRQNHKICHQNALTLKKMFHIAKNKLDK